MIQFKPVTKQDAGKLRKYYQDCQYGLCEYSVGTKLMWRNHLHPAWAESAGCLVVRNYIDGQTVFDYPVPGPEETRMQRSLPLSTTAWTRAFRR